MQEWLGLRAPGRRASPVPAGALGAWAGQASDGRSPGHDAGAASGLASAAWDAAHAAEAGHPLELSEGNQVAGSAGRPSWSARLPHNQPPRIFPEKVRKRKRSRGRPLWTLSSGGEGPFRTGGFYRAGTRAGLTPSGPHSPHPALGARGGGLRAWRAGSYPWHLSSAGVQLRAGAGGKAPQRSAHSPKVSDRGAVLARGGGAHSRILQQK